MEPSVFNNLNSKQQGWLMSVVPSMCNHPDEQIETKAIHAVGDMILIKGLRQGCKMDSKSDCVICEIAKITISEIAKVAKIANRNLCFCENCDPPFKIRLCYLRNCENRKFTKCESCENCESQFVFFAKIANFYFAIFYLNESAGIRTKWPSGRRVPL